VSDSRNYSTYLSLFPCHYSGEGHNNDLGQLVTKTTALGSTHNTYDRLGRLTEVAGPDAGAAYRYYGPTWMRRSAQTPAGLTNYVYDGFACVSQTTGGTTTNYAVPGSAPLWEETANNVLGYAVDGAGNVTGLYGNMGGGQAGWAGAVSPPGS